MCQGPLVFKMSMCDFFWSFLGSVAVDAIMRDSAGVWGHLYSSGMSPSLHGHSPGDPVAG